MLQKKRLGVHIFTRGMKGGIRSINTPVYNVSLYELLKSYAGIQTQNFSKYKYSQTTCINYRRGNKTNKKQFT